MIRKMVKRAIERRRGVRDYQDGEPFYCTFCGSGWNEYGACEDVRCKLETKEAAMQRYKPSAPIPRIPGYNVGDYSNIMDEE